MLARLPRVRVAFFPFARRTCSARSARDWGGVLSSFSNSVSIALRNLIVVISLIAHDGRIACPPRSQNGDDNGSARGGSLRPQNQRHLKGLLGQLSRAIPTTTSLNF